MNLTVCDEFIEYCGSVNAVCPVDGNLTKDDILQEILQCRLEAYIIHLAPFIGLVKALLHYGTIFIVAIGVSLNTLSFVVLTRKNMRRLPSSLFLSFLAVYDSLTLLLNFMIGVIRGQNQTANKRFQDSQSLCKFHGVLVEVFSLLSVWTIVAFTVERYIVVKSPLKTKLFTPYRIFLIIAAESFVVLVFSCHKIFFTGFEGDSVFGYKGCQTDRLRLPGIVYFYVAFNTWLPTLIIMILNTQIIREIRFQQLKRDEMAAVVSRTDRKATRLLLTVSFAYLLLVLPLGIIQTTEVIWNAKVNSTPMGDPEYLHYRIMKIRLKWIRAFFFFFYQINFAVNFFLYVFSSSGTRFRYALKRFLGMRAQPLTSETLAEQTVSRNAIAPAPNS